MKLLLHITSLLSLLLAISNSYSQPCTNTSYRRTYRLPSNYNLEVRSNFIDADNNTLLVCRTDTGNSNINYKGYSYIFIKLKENGNVSWAKKIINTNIQFLYAFTKTIALKNGNYLVSLPLMLNGPNQNDILLLININTDGTILWSTRITFPRSALSNTRASLLYNTSLIEAANNDIYVAANYSNFPANLFSIIHLNANGRLLWDKSFLTQNVENMGSNSKAICAGLHEQGDSLVIAGIALTPNVLFAMKMNKNTAQATKPVAWQRAGNYWDSNLYLVPAFNHITDGYCLVEGGYYNDPVSIVGPMKNIYTLSMNDDLQLKKAAQFTTPTNTLGNTQFEVFDNGKLLVSNIEGSKAYVATINTVTNNILKQQKFYQSGTPEISWWPAITSKDKGATNIALSYERAEDRQECVDIIQYYDNDAIDLTCSGTDTSYLTKENFNPKPADFEWGTILDNIMQQEDAVINLTDIAVNSEYVCGKPSTCNSLKIIGPDTICNYGQEIEFTARLNGDCYKKVTWRAIDITTSSTDFPINMINDTTCSFIYVPDDMQTCKLKLYAYIENCEKLIDSTIIVISPTPDPYLTESELCPGDSIFITAGSGYTDYLWSDGSTQSSTEVSKPGTYTVNFTYCGTKKGLKSIVVSYPETDHFFDNKKMIKCNNDSILISLDNNYTYNWLTSYNIQKLTNGSVKLFPQTDTVYKVSAMVSEFCAITDSIQIQVVNTTPVFLGNDTSICEKTSVVLQAPKGFERYLWNDGFNRPERTIFQKGSYTLTAFDDNGCFSKDTFTLKEVFPLPVIEFPHTNVLCKDQSTILDAGDYKTYQWQNGSNARYFNVTETGRYFVTVTDKNNCIGSDTIVIKAIADTPTHFLSADTSFCEYGNILIMPLKNNFEAFLWNTGSIQNSLWVTAPGLYKLKVTDTNDCKGIEQIEVKTKQCANKLIFPNAFSPNNDGYNDVFKPFVAGKLLHYKLSVFNRWGKEVFVTTDYTQSWKGEKISGTYIWFCNYQFANEARAIQKGYVIVVK